MTSITRDVAELGSADRNALEHLLGRALGNDQQIVVQVVSKPVLPKFENGVPPSGQLPDWCNVYEGLTDAEIGDLEEAVLIRADLSRLSD